MMSVDEAVAIMTAGIARGAPTITFPPHLVLVARAVALLPRCLYEPLAGWRRKAPPAR